MIGLAVVMTALLCDRSGHASWTHRRWIGVAGLAAIGFLRQACRPARTPPAGRSRGLLTAAALVAAYVTLLRFDPTLVPLALGTMAAVRGVAPARPAAVSGRAGRRPALRRCWRRLICRSGGSACCGSVDPVAVPGYRSGPEQLKEFRVMRRVFATTFAVAAACSSSRLAPQMQHAGDPRARSRAAASPPPAGRARSTPTRPPRAPRSTTRSSSQGGPSSQLNNGRAPSTGTRRTRRAAATP